MQLLTLNNSNSNENLNASMIRLIHPLMDIQTPYYDIKEKLLTSKPDINNLLRIYCDMNIVTYLFL